MHFSLLLGFVRIKWLAVTNCLQNNLYCFGWGVVKLSSLTMIIFSADPQTPPYCAMYSVAGPTLWNSIRLSLRPDTRYSRVRKLPTFLENLIFHLSLHFINNPNAFYVLQPIAYTHMCSQQLKMFIWICKNVKWTDQFLCFSLIFSVSVISTCGRQSWLALWSTLGHTIK